jgi:hypothetical protein
MSVLELRLLAPAPLASAPYLLKSISTQLRGVLDQVDLGRATRQGRIPAPNDRLCLPKRCFKGNRVRHPQRRTRVRSQLPLHRPLRGQRSSAPRGGTRSTRD